MHPYCKHFLQLSLKEKPVSYVGKELSQQPPQQLLLTYFSAVTREREREKAVNMAFSYWHFLSSSLGCNTKMASLCVSSVVNESASPHLFVVNDTSEPNHDMSPPDTAAHFQQDKEDKE